MEKKIRTAEIQLEFQPYIMTPPVAQDTAFRQAASNDVATVDHWRKIWVDNIKENKANYTCFADHSAGNFFRAEHLKPCIVAGSGPSLKRVGPLLKNRPEGMPLVSCLHNFHYLEDCEAKVDYYVSLDAGEVTIEEVTEGGTKSDEEYWDLTKDRKLIAFIGTSPRLLKKWQGEVYFFNSQLPDDSLRKEIDEIEPFHLWIESGGCVLGACMMFAKGVLGSSTTIFVGADFSFSNYGSKRMFHSWNSKYDKDIGHCVRAVDIFGNSVFTWQSYYNFSLWFGVVSQRLPGEYINCSEGGVLGAFREGNLINIKQMWFDEMLDRFTMERHKEGQCLRPWEEHKTIFI